MIKKAITYLVCLLGLAVAAHTGALAQNAGDWKLVGTETKGAGGFWEDGQKVRIDRSYKAGNFSYERKVSSENSLKVFSSKGKFAEPEKSYAPGESFTLGVSVSTSGDAGAAPANIYGRVTLVSEAGEELLASARGETVSSPALGETRTLAVSGKTPSQGTEMSIVLSCNGVDVVFKYQREAGAAVEEASPAEEITENPAEEISDRVQPEPFPELETTGFPLVKILLLAGILILIVLDLFFMFRRPRQ